MKLFLKSLIFCLLFVSCSNLSKNMTKEGEFSIRGGVVGNYKWSEALSFKRVSWYHELTLLFDVMYTQIDEKSPFYSWFSEDEKRRISNCGQNLLTISYALDSERISQQMFKNKLKNYELEEVMVSNFSKALKMHPDFESLSLSLYKVSLYCHRNKLSAEIFINFPNFNEIKL